MRHPDLYFKSVFRCVSRSVIPSEFFSARLTVSEDGIQSYRERSRELGTEFDLNAKNPEATLSIIHSAYASFKATFASMPVISLFFTCGFYGGWLPLTCFVLVLYQSKRKALAYLPILVSVLVLLASPTSMPRYVIPLLYACIPMLGWVAYSYHSQAEDKPQG